MSTLASIKAHCISLTDLELHADKITSETESLDQALEAAEIVTMPCLKVGATSTSGIFFATWWS